MSPMSIEHPRRRSSLTGRAAILTAVVALVFATVSLPLRDLVAQRQRIAALASQAQAASGQLAQMNDEITKWNDPNFVAVQARERLHFVLPGEVGYTVLEPDNAPVLYRGSVPEQRSQSWYAAMWGGIVVAGHTAAPVSSGAGR